MEVDILMGGRKMTNGSVATLESATRAILLAMISKWKIQKEKNYI